ncbi:hypothetical protein ABIF61_007724 [Bradyrhizobium japonicum]
MVRLLKRSTSRLTKGVSLLHRLIAKQSPVLLMLQSPSGQPWPPRGWRGQCGAKAVRRLALRSAMQLEASPSRRYRCVHL